MSSHPVHRDRDRENMARRQARALGATLQKYRDPDDHRAHHDKYRLLSDKTNEPLLPATPDDPYPFTLDEVERWIAERSARR